MKRACIALALIGLISACTTTSPEQKLRERLIAAGLKPRLAGCMADRLVRKLSDEELKSLDRLAKIPARSPGHMSIDELGYRLQALNDPHVVDVVTRSGLGCAIFG